MSGPIKGMKDFAPGVSVDDYHTGRCYVGTKTALIAAGVAQDGWFPGDPGRPQTVSRDRLPDGRRVHIRYRSPGSDLFNLTHEHTPEEARAYSERAERDEATREAQRTLDHERRELEALPASRRAFHGAVFDTAARCFSHALVEAERERGGYRYPAEVIERFKVALAEALAVLRDGDVRFDAQRRAAEIAGIRASTAAGDPLFRAFLQRAAGEVRQ